MVGVCYDVLVVSIMTVLQLSSVRFDPAINQLDWTRYFQHNSHYPLMTTNECLTQTGPVFIGRGTRCSPLIQIVVQKFLFSLYHLSSGGLIPLCPIFSPDIIWDLALVSYNRQHHHLLHDWDFTAIKNIFLVFQCKYRHDMCGLLPASILQINNLLTFVVLFHAVD